MSNLKNRMIAHRHHVPRSRADANNDVARAYDHVGSDYLRYADGNALSDPLKFEASLAFADGLMWRDMKRAVDILVERGEGGLRLLDAGCGPGTWLRRIAAYATRQGLDVEAIGVDISEGQLAIARENLEPSLVASVHLMRHDMADPLPWADGYFHLVVCNYVVLNHIPSEALPKAVAELCRVSAFRVIASVRGLAGPQTACITSLAGADNVRYDEAHRELIVRLADGSRHRLFFNLVTAKSLAGLVTPHARVVDLRAVDIFVTRFSPLHWTPVQSEQLPGAATLRQGLIDLEEQNCRRPEWLDRGTHVLVVAERD